MAEVYPQEGDKMHTSKKFERSVAKADVTAGGSTWYSYVKSL